jgi:nuclear transport factor 2 (NTF2) superfamily protein
VDVEAAARAWATGWERAWRARDADAVAALYAADAVFRSHPFRAPHLGRSGASEYAAWAFAEEDAVRDVRFGEPIATGSRAAVEYWAIVVENGAPVTIAGIAVVRFDDAGLVAEQHDYWAVERAARPAWEGWGS